MATKQAAIEQAWYRGAPWLWLLRPVEAVFRGIVLLRRLLYQQGLLSVYRSPLPVVVVGNITVGGTGKTPVVVALVEELQRQGLVPGVVSRGYGARGTQFPHLVGRDSRSVDCGDEPLMIYRRTGCAVVVAPSRPAAVACLLEKSTPDIILCDDGLQHYALARDMEIAVLDAQRGTGNGFCLPAGPLREPLSRLQRVDYLLYRGGTHSANGVRYRPMALVNLVSGEQLPFDTATLGSAVYAVAGIGQPQQFFDSLRRAGFDVVEQPFPDHHDFDAADFEPLSDRPIIMSEKDAVKCGAIARSSMWYLKIVAELPPAVLDAVVTLARSHRRQ